MDLDDLGFGLLGLGEITNIIGSLLGIGTGLSNIEYRKMADEANAQMNDYKANVALQNSANQINIIDQHFNKSIHTYKANVISSGFAPTGTQSQMIDESAFNAQMDELGKAKQGELQAYGYKVGSAIDRWDSKVADAQKPYIIAGGILGGIGGGINDVNSWIMHKSILQQYLDYGNYANQGQGQF